MEKRKVLVERQGRVAIVTLNEPETRNSLSPVLVRELCAFAAGARRNRGTQWPTATVAREP